MKTHEAEQLLWREHTAEVIACHADMLQAGGQFHQTSSIALNNEENATLTQVIVAFSFHQHENKALIQDGKNDIWA